MLKLFPALSICFTLYSCTFFHIAESKRNISDLAIEWDFSQKVNPVYKEKIDSVFEAVMNRFNADNHSFSVHKRLRGEENYLTLSFVKGKFVSKGGLIAGYIISGLGLVAAPATILYLSEGTMIAAFYYFPTDNLSISGSLSPALSDDKAGKMFTLVQTGALFSNKTKRMKKISKKLDQRIYKILLKLDKQLLMKK
jgi:hypothetical protein